MSLLSAVIAAALGMALIETPLFTVIAGLAMGCFYASANDWLALELILIEMNRLASMPVLVALPLFILAGCLLSATEAPGRILKLMQALLGWLPGGVAVAALCACALFTALTGASGVTIVALGGVLYPVLRSRYPERFTLGLLTTGGSLGLLFPPSLPIILYGVVAHEDITRLFRGALLPGLAIVGGLCLYAGLREAGRRRGHQTSEAVASNRWVAIKDALREGIWEWPLLIVVGVGIYGGYFSLAEVAAVVAAYLLVVACWVRREVAPLKQLPGIMVESAILAGAIIAILGVALGLTAYLVDQQIPDRILDLLTGITANRWLFLAGLNLFLLLVGCLMDIFSAITIIVPILVPVAASYGIDPVHLGIIFMVNLEIGYATPPVGLNLFIASLRFRKPLGVLYRASLPFLLLLLGFLALITYLPAFSLCLMP